MAPARPTRGRPSGREPRSAAGTPKKAEPVTAAESGEPVAKRGRGRPPKNGVSKVKKAPAEPKEPSGRGRGRPPKTDAEKAATPKKTGNTPKKYTTSASKKASTASANNARTARASKRKSSDAAAAEDVEVDGEEEQDEDLDDAPDAAVDDEEGSQADSDVDLGADADRNAGIALDDDEDEDDDAPGYVAGDVDVPEHLGTGQIERRELTLAFAFKCPPVFERTPLAVPRKHPGWFLGEVASPAVYADAPVEVQAAHGGASPCRRLAAADNLVVTDQLQGVASGPAALGGFLGRPGSLGFMATGTLKIMSIITPAAVRKK
ncbi:hypothetical protein PG988_015715 [Apiospora saccharicola]